MLQCKLKLQVPNSIVRIETLKETQENYHMLGLGNVLYDQNMQRSRGDY